MVNVLRPLPFCRKIGRMTTVPRETLRTALTERGALPHLQAHLVAEVVTAAWRVAWQSFDREQFQGRDRDPLSLFDETVRELGGLLPG